MTQLEDVLPIDKFKKSLRSHSFIFVDENNLKINESKLVTLMASKIKCLNCNRVFRLNPKEVKYPITFDDKEEDLLYTYLKNTYNDLEKNNLLYDRQAPSNYYIGYGKRSNNLSKLISYYDFDCEENNIKEILE